MSAVAVAELRLQLARLLAADGRNDEAMNEAKAALAETSDPASRWQSHHLIGVLLATRSRLTDAVGEWIHALVTAPKLSEGSAMAAAMTLDGPRAEILARQITTDQVQALGGVAARTDATFASQLLWLRIQRLRDRAELPLPTAPQPLSDDLRALLAEEYAARDRLDEALSLLDGSPPAKSLPALAVRARLLIRLGRPREVLHLALPADLPPADPSAQSLAASLALAQLAAQQPDLAAEVLEPYLSDSAVEVQLAAVVVALARRDYAAAESVLVRLESLSGRSDDIRLLRAQTHLERGEPESIERGDGLLKRLAQPKDPTHRPTTVMWLRLQQEARSADDLFGFVWVVWSASSGDPALPSVLANARRRSTTHAQDAWLDVLWADQLAGSDPHEAASRLAGAANSWELAQAPDRALPAARRAEELHPGAYTEKVARALNEQGNALLVDPTRESVAEAMKLAQESWALQPSEDAASVWAGAVVTKSYDDPGREAEPLLLQALAYLSSLDQTSFVTGYRGLVLSRLGETAQQARMSYHREAAHWLLATALITPEARYIWDWLAGPLAGLGAYSLSLAAAERARELADGDPSSLAAVIAARTNQFGTSAGLENLVDTLEEKQPSMVGWATGIRLKLALLDGRLGDATKLLAGELERQTPWVATTIAEARLLLDDPQARESADDSLRQSLELNTLASAARMQVLQGRVAETLELCAQAEQTGSERVLGLRSIRAQARLVAGDLDAESELLATISHNSCPGDLRSDLAIDLPLLLRTVPAGSPAASAVNRLIEASRARLAVVETAPPVSPAEDLDEAESPGLVALAELWWIDRAPDAEWAEVDAQAAIAVREAAPDLLATVESAAAAVRDRAARRLLDAVELLPADEERADEAFARLAQTSDWVGALADQEGQGEGRALITLTMVLSRGAPLAEAAGLAGLSPEQAQPEWLGERWARRVPDVASWWRLHDRLSSQLPADLWPAFRGALTNRLTELSGMTVVPTIDSRSPQSVLIGSSLVPADTSPNWIMFTTYVPDIRKTLLTCTGVEVPGFNLRGDGTLDGCLTYTLSDRILEFAELPAARRIRPAGPDEPADLVDPVNQRPLRLITDPSPAGPEEPIDDGPETSGEPSMTWLMARHLMAWSTAHLAELYFPYHVNEVARTRPKVVADLDGPRQVLQWLDVARQAIRERRKLDADIMAPLLLGRVDGQDVVEAAAARVIADLPPWEPLPEDIP